MQTTLRRHCRSVFTSVVGGVAALTLIGCSVAATGTEAPEQPAAEQPAAEDVQAFWADESTSAVIIEFERDGQLETVGGEIPEGLLSCAADGKIAISSKSPDPGIGVLLSFVPETPVAVSIWA